MNWLRITRIAIVAALTACGSGYGSSSGVTNPPPPPPKTVAATPSLAFTPANLNVAVGDEVTFAFGSVGHNVLFTTTGAPANIDGVNANVSVKRTFNTQGTFDYHCTIHPSMTGKVVVQ